DALAQSARDVNRLIANVPGVVDNFDGLTQVGPSVDLTINEQRARLVGLSADAVQHIVESAVTGQVVGQVLEGDRSIPLALWFPPGFREDVNALRTMSVVTPTGAPAFLSSLADLSSGPEIVQRTRENLRQLVRVTARLDGRDLGSATAEIQAAVKRTT